MKREMATANVLTARVVQKVQSIERASTAPVIVRERGYTKDSVIEAYHRLGSIKSVCLDTGAPPYVVYKWLKIGGLLKPNDAVKYGTTGAKAGAKAELEFKKLVPFAMETNKHLETNCPSFDFDIGGTTIDVKFSSLHPSGKWNFRSAQGKAMHPDFYVLFCATDGKKDMTGKYKVLVIPSEILGTVSQVCINKNGGMYDDFEIEPSELADFFRDYIDD